MFLFVKFDAYWCRHNKVTASDKVGGFCDTVYMRQAYQAVVGRTVETRQQTASDTLPPPEFHLLIHKHHINNNLRFKTNKCLLNCGITPRRRHRQSERNETSKEVTSVALFIRKLIYLQK